MKVLRLLALIFAGLSNAVGAAEQATLESRLHFLEHSNPAVKLGTIAELRRSARAGDAFWMGDMTTALPILFSRLAHPEELREVRRFAAISLFQAATMAGAGEQTSTAEEQRTRAKTARAFQKDATRLAQYLDDPDPVVREYLTRVMAALMPRPPVTVVPGLLSALDDPVTEIRGLAMLALSRIRPVSEEVLTALVRHLEDPGSPGEVAAGAIGQALTPDAGALLTLAIRLESEDPEVQLEAVSLLGTAGRGRETELASRMLRSLAVDSTEREVLRARAGELVAELDNRLASDDTSQGERAVEALIQSLDDPREEVRFAVVTTLGRLGHPATASREALVAVSMNPDEEPRIKGAAAAALRRLNGPSALVEDPGAPR